MTDLRQEFWKRLDDVQAGMLGLDGQDRLVPMSPQVDDDVPGHVWFITAKGTDLAEGVASGPKDARFVVADAKSGLYADVAGQLRQSNDREALDEVWEESEVRFGPDPNAGCPQVRDMLSKMDMPVRNAPHAAE